VYSSGFSSMTVLVAAMVAFQAYQDVNMRKQLAQVNPQYFQPSLPVRLTYIAAYLGLGAFLVWAYFFPAGLASVLVAAGL